MKMPLLIRCAFALSLGMAAHAQETLVCLPQPMGDAVAAAIRSATAEGDRAAVAVRVIARRDLESLDESMACVVIADGVALASLERRRAFLDIPVGAGLAPTLRIAKSRRVALPWSVGYEVCGNVSGVPRDARGEVTWETLALAYDLGDRLRIAPPECDRGPWLLAMQETLLRGGQDNAVFGVWTALDARIGAYEADYLAMQARMEQDRQSVVVLPEPIAAALGSEALAQRIPFAAGVPIGVAALDGSGRDAAISMFLRILEPSIEQAICRRAGLRSSAASDFDVDVERVEPAFAHFASRIQGQGRHVERVAEWLDYASFAAFAVVLLVLWFRQRKGTSQ